MPFFPGTETEEDLCNVSFNPKLKKIPKNIIFHIRANDVPYKKENIK